MKKVNLTCVECPMGCALEVELDGEVVVSVIGNTCPRGKMYAQNEVTCPMRVLTTTVRCADGRMVSVKTDNPIKKSNMLALMKIINGIVVTAPVSIGDVIMKNIEGDVNLVATDCVK
jgi:CxxC motif-containing protein